MATGAVGALRFVKSAARAAALVKDYTRHSILVGDQATAFAVAMGLEYSSLTTQASAELHRDWERNKCQPNFRAGVIPKARTSCGPYSRAPAHHDSHSPLRNVPMRSQPAQTLFLHARNDATRSLASDTPRSRHVAQDHEVPRFLGQFMGSDSQVVGISGGPRRVQFPARSAASESFLHEVERPGRRCGMGWPGPGAHDTIAILATDTSGNTAAATSTNGNCGKVPGRVGDAAIPGAGAYAVTGVGACGATGDGDIMMRFLPCYRVCPTLPRSISWHDYNSSNRCFWEASSQPCCLVIYVLLHDRSYLGAL